MGADLGAPPELLVVGSRASSLVGDERTQHAAGRTVRLLLPGRLGAALWASVGPGRGGVPPAVDANRSPRRPPRPAPSAAGRPRRSVGAPGRYPRATAAATRSWWRKPAACGLRRCAGLDRCLPSAALRSRLQRGGKRLVGSPPDRPGQYRFYRSRPPRSSAASWAPPDPVPRGHHRRMPHRYRTHTAGATPASSVVRVWCRVQLADAISATCFPGSSESITTPLIWL